MPLQVPVPGATVSSGGESAPKRTPPTVQMGDTEPLASHTLGGGPMPPQPSPVVSMPTRAPTPSGGGPTSAVPQISGGLTPEEQLSVFQRIGAKLGLGDVNKTTPISKTFANALNRQLHPIATMQKEFSDIGKGFSRIGTFLKTGITPSQQIAAEGALHNSFAGGAGAGTGSSVPVAPPPSPAPAPPPPPSGVSGGTPNAPLPPAGM